MQLQRAAKCFHLCLTGALQEIEFMEGPCNGLPQPLTGHDYVKSWHDGRPSPESSVLAHQLKAQRLRIRDRPHADKISWRAGKLGEAPCF